MKLKGKNFIIPLAIYPFEFMFSIAESDKTFQKQLRSILSDKDFASMLQDGIMKMEDANIGCARTVRLRSGQTMIRIPHKIDTPKMHGVVAHEIFHAIEFLFRRIEIKLCTKSDEAYAYAIGYVTEKFYEEIDK